MSGQRSISEDGAKRGATAARQAKLGQPFDGSEACRRRDGDGGGVEGFEHAGVAAEPCGGEAGGQADAGARGSDGGPPATAAEAAHANRRAWVRMSLVRDYQLESAFIGVPKLSRILGVSPSTIWSHMRAKKFWIPYRMFNTTPTVCVDDLVDWYCSRDDLVFPEAIEDARPAVALERDRAEAAPRARGNETDNIVDNALASLGMAPRRRRGPR